MIQNFIFKQVKSQIVDKGYNFLSFLMSIFFNQIWCLSCAMIAWLLTHY